MNFLIYGEDRRHAILSDLLKKAGFVMQAPAELLILSPKESFLSHKDVLQKHCLIWGGIPDETVSMETEGYQKLAQRELFRIKNSVYTAEGAVSLAITESNTALCESNISVLGYGYLGKECARLFSSLEASVTVYTENPEEQCEARKRGFPVKKLTELSDLANTVLINTVPAPILDRLPVSCGEQPALLIELASIPCISKEVQGLRILPAGALPSRFSPESAAKLIFDEIMYQLKKE